MLPENNTPVMRITARGTLTKEVRTGFESSPIVVVGSTFLCSWRYGEIFSGHALVSLSPCLSISVLCPGAFQVAQKVLKNAKQACQRLGQYRMPFAWAAR